ncbi:hypothetical protein GCM10022284_69180 [Streptomyces hundungensis]
MVVVADLGEQRRPGAEAGRGDRLVGALAAGVDGEVGAEHRLPGLGPALDPDDEVRVGGSDDQQVVFVGELLVHEFVLLVHGFVPLAHGFVPRLYRKR